MKSRKLHTINLFHGSLQDGELAQWLRVLISLLSASWVLIPVPTAGSSTSAAPADSMEPLLSSFETCWRIQTQTKIQTQAHRHKKMYKILDCAQKIHMKQTYLLIRFEPHSQTISLCIVKCFNFLFLKNLNYKHFCFQPFWRKDNLILMHIKSVTTTFEM